MDDGHGVKNVKFGLVSAGHPGGKIEGIMSRLREVRSQDNVGEGHLYRSGSLKILVYLKDLINKNLRVKWFEEIVKRPYLQGFYGGLYGGVGGHHYYGKIGEGLMGPFKEFNTVHPGHLDIRKHQVIRFG